jgi:chemotaxis family two-component system response regulator Rcp1
MNSGKTHGMEILLVEDSLSNANLTIKALKHGNVQCRVTLVCDGEEAIRFLCRKEEFARAPTPDLILLDMSLPKKDGRQVLVEIRSDEELKHIPVIVLTGSGDHEATLKAEGLYVDGFLTKPVEWTAFIETVKSLRRSRLMELLQTP